MSRIESRLNRVEKIVKPKDESIPVFIIRLDGDGLPDDCEEWLTYKKQKDSPWPIILTSEAEIEERKRKGLL
jgi:hypothetical protein